jgi:hypothetical protein
MAACACWPSTEINTDTIINIPVEIFGKQELDRSNTKSKVIVLCNFLHAQEIYW